MAENKKYKELHNELGELTIEIIANNEGGAPLIIGENTKDENLSSFDFLCRLYEDNMSNTRLVNIIGSMLTNNNLGTHNEIIAEINKRYSASTRKTTDPSDTLKKGDCFSLRIYGDDANIAYYTANVIIKANKSQQLMGYVDTNETEPEYRQKGLQKMGFRYLERYLTSNNIELMGLEAQDLDGNDFNLYQVYMNLGFEQIGNTNKFVKNIMQQEQLF